MTTININGNGSVWVVCIYGFIWRLRLVNIREATKIGEKEWEKVEHARLGGKFKEVASGDDLSVWALDCDGHLWVRQFNSAMCTSSIGVYWIHVCAGVVHVSCASQRLVWAVLAGGQLAERIGITNELPQGTEWRVKLDGIATHVCIHGA